MKMTTRTRLWLHRRSMYRAVFLDANGAVSEHGEAVLFDLAKFCHALKPSVRRSYATGLVDAHATMVAEGRREVFNRIAQCLRLSESQIYALLENEYGRPES